MEVDFRPDGLAPASEHRAISGWHEGTRGGGMIAIAKTVKPIDDSTSIVIDPRGPQIQSGQTQLSAYNDVVYSAPTTNGKDTRLVMDIKVSRTQGLKPLVIYIPGGGFVMAEKITNLNQLIHVAEQGFAVASITYRTVIDGASWRDSLTDVKSAIR